MKAWVPEPTLSPAMLKAMKKEMHKQMAEYDRKNMNELDSCILWVLHEEFGFGPKRLKHFYNTFGPALDSLIEHYELDNSDKIWICTYKLKEYGIDIEEWNKERSKKVKR